MGSAVSKISSAWGKSAQAKRLARLLVFCVLVALYVLFFPLLHQTFGGISIIFSWCYIGLSVWFWGLRGGVLAALFNYPLNMVLLKSIGAASMGGFLTPILSVSAAAFFGWLRDLSLRLREELSERKNAEEALRNAQDALEQRVSERTADLQTANEQLRREITERKRSEEALQAEKEFTESALAAQIDTFFVFEPATGKAIRWNKAFKDISGYSDEEIQSMKAPDSYYNKEDLEKTARVIETISQKGQGTVVMSLIDKDGKKIPTEYSASIVFDKEGNPEYIILVGRDIKERIKADKEKKMMEDQLHRAQKMEAMGLMAGGVAHDLNNILSGIVSYPELLLMDLPANSPLRKPIETIKESGMQAADVVADLLTIARGVATGKEALNLNTIVTEYLGTPEYQNLERTSSFVVLKTELDLDLLNISGSPSHIKKTLMNLVTNASEAIEGSGSVIISTENRYLDEPLKGYDDVRQGEYAVLSISDEGTGISPQDLERIFEPFYTKKVMGRSGTGLGLAVVWNTVQDHNGFINVNTSEKGTVFELYFPVTRDEVTAEKKEAPMEDYLGHGEKTLVVDDEERQREIASGMLTKLGYNAETVSSGEEAIEYVKKHPVDLILLDMVMPKGINGRETYEQIIKIRPGQKAIIASGYAKTREVDTAQELGAGEYIKKPYTLAKVGLAVKEELEK